MNDSNHHCSVCGTCMLEATVSGRCAKCLLDLAADPAMFLAKPTPSGNGARDFGDYKLLEEIARGGMGVVFKARQVSLNRIVALKMVRAGEQASSDSVRRFYIEAEAAASLEHPHIVPVYEIGEHQGQHYFCMRFLEGGTLARKISQGELRALDEKNGVSKATILDRQRTIARLMVTIARAVQFAHQHGILHRDLKPGNILLDTQGQPHVTDFGVAKLLTRDSSFTQSLAVLGTPSYMAPEQAGGQTKRLTTSADVYGLGAILYELLTGRPPFRGADLAEIMREIQERAPVKPRSLNPSISKDLETICLKCLEKQPQSRYGSAGALAEDLERWMAGEPIHARPVSLPEKLWRACRREPVLAGMIAGLFMLVTASAALAWTLFERERESLVAKEHENARQLKALFDRITDANEDKWPLVLSANELGFLLNRDLAVDGTEETLILGCRIAEKRSTGILPIGRLADHLRESLWNRNALAVLFDLQLYDRHDHLRAELIEGRPHFFCADPAAYVLARQATPELTIIAQEVYATQPMLQGAIFTSSHSGITNLAALKGRTFAFEAQEVYATQPMLRGAIFTSSHSGITNLAGLKGRTFAFEVLDSALGWHLPRAALVEAGIFAADLRETTNLSSFRVLSEVRRRRFDAGVARLDMVDALLKAGAPLVILQELHSPSPVWVATSNLSTNLILRLRETFLSLRDSIILEHLDPQLSGFVPARASDFDALERQIDKATQFENP
jgi:ABC-type phosphate/phosphonate transport system substrate-binding protein